LLNFIEVTTLYSDQIMIGDYQHFSLCKRLEEKIVTGNYVL